MLQIRSTTPPKITTYDWNKYDYLIMKTLKIKNPPKPADGFNFKDILLYAGYLRLRRPCWLELRFSG
jgi:hypothetical protein